MGGGLRFCLAYIGHMQDINISTLTMGTACAQSTERSWIIKFWELASRQVRATTARPFTPDNHGCTVLDRSCSDPSRRPSRGFFSCHGTPDIASNGVGAKIRFLATPQGDITISPTQTMPPQGGVRVCRIAARPFTCAFWRHTDGGGDWVSSFHHNDNPGENLGLQ
jgi:hypothetical protein